MSSTKILLEEKGEVEIALEDRCSLEISPRSHASAFVTDTSIPSWLYSIFVCIALVLASRRKPVCSIQGSGASYRRQAPLPPECPGRQLKKGFEDSCTIPMNSKKLPA